MHREILKNAFWTKTDGESVFWGFEDQNSRLELGRETQSKGVNCDGGKPQSTRISGRLKPQKSGGNKGNRIGRENRIQERCGNYTCSTETQAAYSKSAY